MKRKVAIYARVSTEHEAQLSALDNQVQYYDGILKQHPDWILYDRYITNDIKRVNYYITIHCSFLSNYLLLIFF